MDIETVDKFLKEFKDKVKEMKKYHIGKDGLYQTINEVYEEEYHD